MQKFRLLVDIDSMVEEGEHLEDIFSDGIEGKQKKKRKELFLPR